ncbi:NAD-dependent succinate-semialdehyde dehydrogenase [Nocardia sp. FBN12]|uniref:NAD-dependent succinate-semialdehyde dehydrogenase n=1 Tax=Nocardia sp. FBN12 TaxID=3419766 RepID=UPI003D063ADD
MIDATAVIADTPQGLWIDGAAVDATDGYRYPVLDPATGDTLTTVADARAIDAMRAIESADRVQRPWAVTAPRERSQILRRAWELVTERAEDLALLMTAEMGRALPDSRAEVAYGAEFLRWFSEEAVRVQGRYTPAPAGNGRILVTKAPVGPVLAITPWNFPLAMGTRKIGPALAAGCTVIVKPAAETPLTMLALARIFAEAGLPAGVLSVLPTSDAASISTPLFADPRLRKLTFTGSTRVGRILLARAASGVLRTSMELGGNAPFLVFDDADLDAAINGAMAAKMRNGGQACTAANRFLVADAVLEEFTARLTERMAALTVGAGHRTGVAVGPLVSAAQLDRVAGLVDEAVAAGARIRTGGKPLPGPGFFYPPTVLDQIPVRARILDQEIFGPVAVVTGFGDEAEAIDRANASEYGLAAYLYTRDLGRALRVTDALETGMVAVNRGVLSDVAAPFGGVKASGLGHEGGVEGIDEYLDSKYVALTN